MKKNLFFALLLAVSYTYGQTDTIVKWTFPDSALAVAPYPDGGLSMNSSCFISAHGGTSAINYKNTGATSYCARTTGWSNGSGVKYWQVFFATTGHQSMKFSSKQRSSGTGPRSFKVQFRLSALNAWTDVPSATVLDSNNWTYGVLTDIDLPSACDDQDSVFLCWVMTSDSAVNDTALVAAGGSSRIDDIIVTGTIVVGVNSNSPVPSVEMIQNNNAHSITLFMNESAKVVEIYDMLGNMVFSNRNTNRDVTISTSAYKNGIYIIKIFFDDTTVVTKKISVI